MRDYVGVSERYILPVTSEGRCDIKGRKPLISVMFLFEAGFAQSMFMETSMDGNFGPNIARRL